jgi:hypothetical protein
MAMGVMPTESATRRMLTESGPSLSRIASAAWEMRSAVEDSAIALQRIAHKYTVDSFWFLK